MADMANAQESHKQEQGSGRAAWRLAQPPRLALIAPSILSADFATMGEECRHVLEAGADMLHLDVMDGHFAPNLTMGPAMCASLRRALPGTFLDVHLMVTSPGQFVEAFSAAGADSLTFHAEVAGPAQAAALAAQIRGLGMGVGIAINPGTPVDSISELLGLADMLLVMSVNPGYSGQAFIESSVEKTRALRAKLSTHQRLQMDGGLAPVNAARVREAGCDCLVAASAVFGKPREERAGVIARLRG